MAPLLGGMPGRKEEMTTCVAVWARFAEITGIAVYGEDHVTGIEGEDCIILGGSLV